MKRLNSGNHIKAVTKQHLVRRNEPEIGLVLSRQQNGLASGNARRCLAPDFCGRSAGRNRNALCNGVLGWNSKSNARTITQANAAVSALSPTLE
jgi:hypothetical protein